MKEKKGTPSKQILYIVVSRRSLPHIALVEQDMKMEHGFSSIYLIWYVSHKDMMSIYDTPKLGRSMPLSNFIIIKNTFNFFVVFFLDENSIKETGSPPSYTHFHLLYTTLLFQWWRATKQGKDELRRTERKCVWVAWNCLDVKCVHINILMSMLLLHMRA